MFDPSFEQRRQMNAQITSHIFMMRPVAFRYNNETASNNYYQKVVEGLDDSAAQKQAENEFDAMVVSLTYLGIDVTVISDTKVPDTPDSIFPNNWVSFHSDGTVGLYPMFAENRRKERNPQIIEEIGKKFQIRQTVDFSSSEEEQKYLEGTGSLLLDRQHKIAYAAISSRTHPELLENFSRTFDYKIVSFLSNQTVEGLRQPIYHTNVMMCLGETFAVICLESIDDAMEKFKVIESLQRSGKEIIEITEDQVNSFAGNMLQLKNEHEERFIVMSTAAFHSLTRQQKDALEKTNKIVHSSLDTIEACGGGSARCMMAEIFLPEK